MQFSTISTTLISASALLLPSVHADHPSQLDQAVYTIATAPTIYHSRDLFFSNPVYADSFVCEDFSHTALGYNESSFCSNDLSADNLSCNLTGLELGFTLSSSGTEQDSLVFFTGGRISPAVDENVVLFRFTDDNGVVTFDDDKDVTAVSLELAVLDIPELANVTSRTATIHVYGENDVLLGSLEVVPPREHEESEHEEEVILSKFQFVGLTSESAIRKIVFDAPVITSVCFGTTSGPKTEERSHHYDTEPNDNDDTIKDIIFWVMTSIAAFVIGALTVLGYFKWKSSNADTQQPEEKAAEDTEVVDLDGIGPVSCGSGCGQL